MVRLRLGGRIMKSRPLVWGAIAALIIVIGGVTGRTVQQNPTAVANQRIPMNADYIKKSDVSAAVSSATSSVKPLLLAAEAAAQTENAQATQEALAALHAALASELAGADALLGTGTTHTDGGGTDKGDGNG